jgi:sugar/nucleoside kinase (ribokinase family)
MFDFCGIGNACIDIIASVDDEFLTKWEFPKSICTPIPLDRANALEAALSSPSYIPGGCGANTAAVVSALGGRAAFIGKIADDAIGKIFRDDMAARNIRYTRAALQDPDAGSTRIFALITPDSERTFASYYGIQEQLSPDDLDIEAIEQSKLMYLDGYGLNSPRGGETFIKAAHLSRAAGHKAVFSPSDVSILNNYRDITRELISLSEIILCNEQEARFLSEGDSIADMVRYLQEDFDIGAVTAGDQGVYVFNRTNMFHVPAAKPHAPVIDSNGAGDAFAGGFLYGLCRGYDLPRAAALGNRCAATIITHSGARPVQAYTSYITE